MKALDVPLNIGDIQFYKNIKKTESNKDKYNIFGKSIGMSIYLLLIIDQFDTWALPTGQAIRMMVKVII